MKLKQFRVQLVFKAPIVSETYRASIADVFATSKAIAAQIHKDNLCQQINGVQIAATYVAWIDAPWGVADAEKESIQFEETEYERLNEQ